MLCLINLYPPHALGGYELSCQDVVHRWRAAGHQVSVVTTTTRLADVAGDDEPDVHRVLEWYWADHRVQRPSPLTRLRIERANRRRLANLLERYRPDVVSVWAMGCMSLSLLSVCLDRGRPMTVVAADDWLSYGPRADAWLSAWARRPAAVRRFAAQVSGVPTQPPALSADVPVAFVSDFIRQQAAVTAGAISFSTSEIVPPGIDREDFPAQPRAERPWRGRLLCVGRIEPRKGFDIAVRALAQLPDATLRLVGPSTDHLDHLRTLAAELGVADRLAAEVAPRAELAAVYRGADALLFPSRWDEPFGLVPLEAMSQATPVVATRRGGSAEFLVDGVNCLAVDRDDPAAVAAAVARLAADPALRQRLTTGGIETAARYDVDGYADRLEALHQDAVGARG